MLENHNINTHCHKNNVHSLAKTGKESFVGLHVPQAFAEADRLLSDNPWPAPLGTMWLPVAFSSVFKRGNFRNQSVKYKLNVRVWGSWDTMCQLRVHGCYKKKQMWFTWIFSLQLLNSSFIFSLSTRKHFNKSENIHKSNSQYESHYK